MILVTIMRSYSADSSLIFEVAEEPKPGQVRVLLDFCGNTELLHLEESIAAAERPEQMWKEQTREVCRRSRSIW